MPLSEQKGGGELMLLHLMQQGQDQGVEWLVIFFEDGPMVTQFQQMGVETHVAHIGRLRHVHRFLPSVAEITRVLRRKHASVLVSWMALPHFYGSLAAKAAGIPSLWYQLGVPHRRNRLDQIATRLPGLGVITLSRAGQEAQAQMPPGRPTPLVYPGVELERFDPDILPTPAEARRRLGLPDSGPLIGIVGRLQAWKGIHVVVEAMPQVLKHYPDAHCVVVGGVHDLEPGYPDYVDSRIAALGLKEKVIMAGLQRNVPEWMQAMDVFVHASNREPFGIVIIEAMALGKPVIAGDAAGPTEIITDGVDGLLTPYGDADTLARAILHYLNDPTFAAQAAAAARARAQDFSTRRYAENFIQAVKSLLP